MVNTITKMRRVHQKARKYLEEMGYKVYICPHTMSIKDIWNLFDAVCINKHGEILFVQIKTNTYGKIKPLSDFVFEYLSYSKEVKVAILRYKDREGFNLRFLSP